MIYVSTIKRLAAWDLLTEKKVWEQTYDGECCDRMALSPDGRTMYVPSFEGMHWYVVDARTGDLIKKLPVPASAGAHNTVWSLDGSKVFMAGLRCGTLLLWEADQPPLRADRGRISASQPRATRNSAGRPHHPNVKPLR